jgi:hypothetical protein
MQFIQSDHILYIMLVLVNYHMDTFLGIGYRSEHIHGGYPCTLYRWMCILLDAWVSKSLRAWTRCSKGGFQQHR